MELQFPKTELEYLKRILWEVKNEEQTLEIKLSDAMPDIGKVLAVWAQPVIRSKEWRGSGMGISGGVMLWIMYQPEDNSGARTVEAWMPFQMRWEFPQTQRDGIMRVGCLLRSADARITSARKLMARAVVSVTAEALEPNRTEIPAPQDVPEDIRLLKRSYPVRLPTEAGEKSFALDEELTVPSNSGQQGKLLYCTVRPELTDKKVMGDKVVFRGSAVLHGLLQGDDGSIRQLDMEVPFSQYAELEQEHDASATADVLLMPTGLETELTEDGKLRMKGGLVGQYVIYDRPVIEVVEDAYSNSRTVELQKQLLQLPAVLDAQQTKVKAEQAVPMEGETVLDCFFSVGYPSRQRKDELTELEFTGMFQLLASGDNGELLSRTARWEGGCQIPSDGEAHLLIWSGITGHPGWRDGNAQCDICMDQLTVTEMELPAVESLVLGEKTKPSQERPSLILCRPEGESLWQIAKRCGSTVDAIREANGVEEEPDPDEILLIPVQ